MKRQRFKFKLLAFFLFALFALLGTYGMHSIALYGNRWFTYAKNPRVRAQKQNVVPGDKRRGAGDLFRQRGRHRHPHLSGE